MYLIWSSVDPDVVRDHESELVMTYLASLLPEVAKKGQRIPTTEKGRLWLARHGAPCTR